MLYSDAVTLSCICGNVLQGTSYNKDEEPGGIQRLLVYYKPLLIMLMIKKRRDLEKLKNVSIPNKCPENKMPWE